MKQLFITAYFIAAMLLVVSCNSESNQAEEVTAVTEDNTATPVIGGDSTLTDEQRQLFEHIASHNLYQVELGKLAAERGVSDNVKQYGQQMIDFHTSKQQELQDMARRYSIELDPELNEDYRDDLEEVATAEQGKFDEEYWENVTDAQKELLDDYDDVVSKISESDASAFPLWARPAMKELRAQMEQALAFELELKTDQ